MARFGQKRGALALTTSILAPTPVSPVPNQSGNPRPLPGVSSLCGLLSMVVVWSPITWECRGWLSNATCLLCHTALATCTHLLVHYRCTHLVWQLFRDWTNKAFPIPSSDFLGTEDWWLQARRIPPKWMRQNFDTVTILIHWRIWKEQNAGTLIKPLLAPSTSWTSLGRTSRSGVRLAASLWVSPEAPEGVFVVLWCYLCCILFSKLLLCLFAVQALLDCKHSYIPLPTHKSSASGPSIFSHLYT